MSDFGKDIDQPKGVEQKHEEHELPFHEELHGIRDAAYKPTETAHVTDNMTQAEHAEALSKLLYSMSEKLARLPAGMADVLGPSYLVKIATDGPDEVRKFMSTIRDYIEKT
jgi:hypothetical protein